MFNFFFKPIFLRCSFLFCYNDKLDNCKQIHECKFGPVQFTNKEN